MLGELTFVVLVAQKLFKVLRQGTLKEGKVLLVPTSLDQLILYQKY